MMKKKYFALLVLALAFFSGTASAGTYDALVTAVNFTDAISAIMSVFAVLAALYVAIKGGKIVLGVLRGA